MPIINERIFTVDVDAYWRALGQFVSLFASVEKNVLRALWHFSGLTHPIAPAVLSGIRVEAALSLITRISDAEDWTEEKKKKLKCIVDQLGEINRVRNDILHYGATFIDPDELIVSTDLVAHVKERVRTTRISVKILGDMVSDLAKLETHITDLAWPHRHDGARDHYDPILRAAWLYKPRRLDEIPQQNPKPGPKQNPKPGPKRRGPPLPSRA